MVDVGEMDVQMREEKPQFRPMIVSMSPTDRLRHIWLNNLGSPCKGFEIREFVDKRGYGYDEVVADDHRFR